MKSKPRAGSANQYKGARKTNSYKKRVETMEKAGVKRSKKRK